MGNLIFVIFVVTSIVVVWLTNRSRSHSDRQRIADYLSSKGASKIVVYTVWLSSDWGNRVYDVEYRDQQGVHHWTRCKINYGRLSDKEIYWLEPLDV